MRSNEHHEISNHWLLLQQQNKLEQLECLCSEDTPAASRLATLLSHIGSQVKRRQCQSYKFKEFAKISNFQILKQNFYVAHLLKLLDKMCKYEMDPKGIVEDTERTRFCPLTDGRTDDVKPVYPPFNFVEAGVIKYQSCVLLVLFKANQQATGGFPPQRASDAKSIYMWWYHQVLCQSHDIWHTINTWIHKL